LPNKPGVYLFFDEKHELLYVGKAKNLRNRVAQYFQKNLTRPWIYSMVKQITAMDFTVVRNEVEALVLENNLIKERRPQFNIRLRDDKNYQYIKLAINDDFPRLTLVRRPTQDRAKYFGPYTSGLDMKKTLKMLRSLIPYVTCANVMKWQNGETKVVSKKTPIPCLYWHIKRCPAPCISAITPEEYQKNIEGIIAFLQGKTDELEKSLAQQMEVASKHQQFERAATMRDKLVALRQTMVTQQINTVKDISLDAVNYTSGHGKNYVCVLQIRFGKMLGKQCFTLDNKENIAASADILGSFLDQYYPTVAAPPTEIILPCKIEAESWQQIKITAAQRGYKRDLLKAAAENAEEYRKQQQLQFDWDKQEALASLQKALKLKKLPQRIECYDISHTFGDQTVGGLATFIGGRPEKSQYKRFEIKELVGGQIDDYAALREVIGRRIKNMEKKNRPDLIIIDGGKGQLSAVLPAVEKQKIAVCALAKRIEEIFLPGRKTSIILPADSPALYLIQQVRDEAHRFAIGYHRTLRSKKQVKSALDTIPGIGSVAKKKLLQRFGSAAGIKQASGKDILEVVNEKQMKSLRENL